METSGEGWGGTGRVVSFITHVRATLFSHGPCVGRPSRRTVLRAGERATKPRTYQNKKRKNAADNLFSIKVSRVEYT